MGSGVSLTLGYKSFPSAWGIHVRFHGTAILQEWLLEPLPLSWVWWHASVVLAAGRVWQDLCLNARVQSQPGKEHDPILEEKKWVE